MFKLKFKKTDCCKLTVEVDATECELTKLKIDAAEKAEIGYNKQKRAALTGQLKEGLFKQYQIPECDICVKMNNVSYREDLLLDAIIDNMVTDLGLMDD